MHDKKNWRWICPESGKIYDLKHLRKMDVSFGVMLEKGAPITKIPCRVAFSNHCYTRARHDGDPDNQVVSREEKRSGETEERVFCPERWDFSLQLPDIVRNLEGQYCLEGRSKEILYRQEGKPHQGSESGWYICMRLDFKKTRDPQLVLWIRSTHWRPNRPIDVRRHGLSRFYVFLARYLKGRI